MTVSISLQRSAKCGATLSEELLDYLAESIRRSADPVDQRIVSDALYGLHRRQESPAVRRLLLAVAGAARRCPEPFIPFGLGVALYGLNQQGPTAETRLLLLALLPLLPRKELQGDLKYAGLALYGLKGQRDTLPECAALLEGVIPVIAAAAGSPSAQSVATALLGLQGHTDSPAVRGVIAALVPRVSGCTEPPQGLLLGLAVHGIKGPAELPGRERRRAPSREVRGLVGALAGFVARSPQRLGPPALCMGLQGLRNAHGSPETRALFRELAALADPGQAMDPESIGVLMHSIPAGGADPAEVRRLLQVVAAQVAVSRGVPYPAETIAWAVHGLQEHEDTQEASNLLGALLPCIVDCRYPFGGSAFGMALFGLQRKTSTRVTAGVLSELARRLSRGEGGEPCPTDVCQALYGLHGLHESDAMRELLAALLPWIRRCPESAQWTSRQVGMAMHGFKERGDSAEGRALLAALAPYFARSHWHDDAQSVSMAIDGLRSQPDTPAVRAVLGALLPRISSCPDLPVLQVASILFGLQGQGSSPLTAAYLRLALNAIRAHPRPWNSQHWAMAVHGVLRVHEGGALQESAEALQELISLGPPSDQPTHTAPVLQALHLAGVSMPPGVTAVDARPGAAAAQAGFHAKCGSERAVEGLLRTCGVPGLRFNVHHASGFEMDLLCGELNIEFQSRSGRYVAAGRQVQARLRDQFLGERHGIRVERLQVAGRPLHEVIDEVAELCGASGQEDAAGKAWDRARRHARWGWSHATREAARVGLLRSVR